MGKSILLILIENRADHAPKTQKVLTKWGCIIKTRLGIHDGVLDNCSNQGLLICELVGDRDTQQQFTDQLNAISGVKAKLVDIGFE
jgi:hypothetical protein